MSKIFQPLTFKISFTTDGSLSIDSKEDNELLIKILESSLTSSVVMIVLSFLIA